MAMIQTIPNETPVTETHRFVLNSDTEARRVLGILRNVFLCLILVGYAFYPLDLWILGHWLEGWQSRIPFVVAIPSVIFTMLMLWRRSSWVRYPFIALMVVNVLTGMTGAIFHLIYNFEGEIHWTIQGVRDAFEGARPILAALAFTHIGFTGLLCSLEPPLRSATEKSLVKSLET
jgi:hypothetical protein